MNMFYKGNKYSLRSKNKHTNTETWNCTRRICKAIVVTLKRKVIEYKNEHTHSDKYADKWP